MATKKATTTPKPMTKAAKKNPAAKRTKSRARKPDGMLTSAAAGAGRTLGKAARSVDKVASAVKKSATALTRGRKPKPPARPKKDPQVALERARTRALWKSQANEAADLELAKHGALVDERARVRSLTGMSWSNRKPR